MRIKKFLIFFLLAVFLLSPVVGLAQFKLQQTYPNVGGSNLGVDANGKPISASQSIPSLVRYLFNLVVWVCILVAIIVLIAGGIQYVTSSGDVGKMSGAKTRIYSSLLGLVILVGAWFVLHTMNPSLVLPRITYIPIKQGIVFFTKEGYCRFMGHNPDCSGTVDVDASIINDLVQANQAKIINNSTPSLTTVFGPLIFSECLSKGIITGNGSNFPSVTINENVNNILDFADFDVYTFAFWGKKAQGAKLSFYNKISYENLDEKTIPLTYDYRGLLDINGEPIKDNNDKQVVTIQTPKKIKDIIVIDPKAFGGEGGREFTLGPSDLGGHEYKTWIISGQSKNAYYYNKSEVQYLNASNYFTVVPADKDKLNTTGASFTQCGKREGATYFNLINDEEFRNSVVVASPKAILHPPMSMKIIWSSPGVYLVDANGDERYFDTSARDLSDPSINFDQKAQTIKIINDTPDRIFIDEDGNKQTTKGETRDFLAILHENDNFSGKLKVYFEQRMYTDEGKIKSSKTSAKATIPAYNTCGIPINKDEFGKTVGKANLATLNKIIQKDNAQLDKLLFQVIKDKGPYYWQKYNFGELPMIKFDPVNGKVDTSQIIATQEPIIVSDNAFSAYPIGDPSASPYGVEEQARYGVLDKDKHPSSVKVFELSQNPETSGECQEVKICTEKSGKGYCLAYTAEQNKTNGPNIVYYPMPWYLPVSLPYDFNDAKFTDISCGGSSLPSFINDGKTKEVVFANNIKSIIIQPEGKCAVVLMGGIIDSPWWEALRWDPLGIKPKSSERNDVFTSSDYNLEDNEIGQCGSTSGFGFGKFFNQSCAGAIAVYPIK